MANVIIMYTLFFRANWVSIGGTVYKKPCVLLLTTREDYPIYGKLEEIYVINSMPHFYVQVLTTVKYCDHFHCFIVQLSGVKLAVLHADLHSFIPSNLRTLPSCTTLCVVPNYHVPCL